MYLKCGFNIQATQHFHFFSLEHYAGYLKKGQWRFWQICTLFAIIFEKTMDIIPSDIINVESCWLQTLYRWLRKLYLMLCMHMCVRMCTHIHSHLCFATGLYLVEFLSSFIIWVTKRPHIARWMNIPVSHGDFQTRDSSPTFSLPFCTAEVIVCSLPFLCVSMIQPRQRICSIILHLAEST